MIFTSAFTVIFFLPSLLVRLLYHTDWLVVWKTLSVLTSAQILVFNKCL